MKKKIILALTVLCCLGLITGCGCNKKQVEKKKDDIVNPNAPVITYQKVGNLKIGTASITIIDDKTNIEISIKNETKKDINVDTIIILIKDSEGKTIKTLTKELGLVKANDEKIISDIIDEKLTNAASFDFQIK